MGAHKPRSGSLAFYPRKRARKELSSFKTFPKADEKSVKPMNFVGYKVGMVQISGRDEHQKSVTFGQDIITAGTVVECPALRVFGIRGYGMNNGAMQAFGEVTIEKPDKHFKRRVVSFKQTHSKKKKEESRDRLSTDWLDKNKTDFVDVRLLVSTQPSLTNMGKKIPDLFEIFLSGSIEQKLMFAKEKLGKELLINEVFKDKDFADVRGVDKGKGFAGVIKRFGVKHHSPKAKKHRVVGSIGPWNPSTVMWTVARAGQLGYQTRTELNKRVLVVGSESNKVNVKNGFRKWGFVKNNYLVLAGSIPGPTKRAIALRHGVRKNNNQFNLSNVTVLGTSTAKKISDDEMKAAKVVVHKEVKKEHASVADEIASAVKGK